MVIDRVLNAVVETIAGFTQQLMKFVIPQILFVILIKKSENQFKFRFYRIEDHPKLKHFMSIWAIGAVALFVYLFSPLFFEFVLGKTINSWLVSLDLLNLLLLTVSLSTFTLLFIVEYLLEKRLDKNAVIFSAITVVSFALFVARFFGYL